ncbi:MAG: DNA-directed RNA polymerase subunit delta [Erysipelotrichaceae bacterium]|nr:DNA-directed RNA polymerase subunit delta [Erysipelotrichaceae bacterium]
MAFKSMTDVAYDIMSSKKRAVAFAKLWQEVVKETNVPADRVAEFYSALTLDNRFVSLSENKWDLKSRRTFAETQVDLAAIELEEDVVEYDENGNVINEPEENY